MLAEALNFPTSGEDGASAVLVGGGLLLVAAVLGFVGMLFPPLLGGALLVYLAVRGYYVRALRAAAGDPGADALSFDDWGDLVVDGIRAALVAVVYLLPALALFAFALGGTLLTAVQDPAAIENPGALLATSRTVFGLAVLFGLLYLVAMFYLLPAAVTNFAYRDRLGAAFHVRTVVRGALSEDYAVAWVLSVVLQVLLLPLAVLLQFLLVGFFLQFLVSVAVRYVYAYGFGRAMGFDPLPEDAAVPTASASDSPGSGDATAGDSPAAERGVTARDDRGATGDTGPGTGNHAAESGVARVPSSGDADPGPGADPADPMADDLRRRREE